VGIEGMLFDLTLELSSCTLEIAFSLRNITFSRFSGQKTRQKTANFMPDQTRKTALPSKTGFLLIRQTACQEKFF
jgi:hypothetical protein